MAGRGIPLTPIRTRSRGIPHAAVAADDEHDDNDDEEAAIFPSSPFITSDPQSPIGPPWRQTLYQVLEHPNSSPSAFMVHLASTALIVFSAIVTILETLPALHSRAGRVWFGIETALVALFTVEYLARAVAWSTSWRRFFGWFGSFFALIDLLAIAPYYIEIALQADTTEFFRFSILRTFRLLRVFRPFRYSNTILFTIEVMFLSFKRSKDALLALSFFVVTTLVIFSTLIYFAERGTWSDALHTFVDPDGEPSQLESIPAAAWFVLVTITTVGYGDVTPRSFLGRLITVPLLLSGLLLIALPSFVLGREFAKIWESMGNGQHDADGPGLLMSPMAFSRRRSSLSLSSSARVQIGRREGSAGQARATEPAALHNGDDCAEDVKSLNKEVVRLRRVVEQQSADLAKVLSFLQNQTSHDT